MKNLLIGIIACQMILISFGIKYLIEGETVMGGTFIILNSIGLGINLNAINKDEK